MDEAGSTLKEAAVELGYGDAATFDRVVDPRTMLGHEGRTEPARPPRIDKGEGEMGMIGRIVGGALGSAIGKRKGNHPVAGAVIGAGALFAARRLFPQRYAALAAWAAAGYLTKKWAERAEASKAAADRKSAL